MNYYGDVDSNLEIKLDTLDDLFGEAGEIDAVNDWVTYGLPLQRFREFGSHIKALDMLDESKLSSDHTVEIVKLLSSRIRPTIELTNPEIKRTGSILIPRCWRTITAKHEKENAAAAAMRMPYKDPILRPSAIII